MQLTTEMLPVGVLIAETRAVMPSSNVKLQFSFITTYTRIITAHDYMLKSPIISSAHR